MKKQILLSFLAVILGGCSSMNQSLDIYRESQDNNASPKVQVSPIAERLEDVPKLDGKKITIAVYGFQDKTGQRKPVPGVSSLSSAVTQGSEVWVIKGLQDVGGQSWFEVVERVGMDNLIKERQLIRNTREVYEKEKVSGPTPLKPLRFAGLILEGGIVGYDANTAVGGVGARFLGIGAQTEYRVDTVTVVIRMVSVSTGRVMLSIATEKSIASTRSGADIFKFLDLGTKAIESETGYSVNEPVNYAVRAAIECAIIELVYEGEKTGLWKFKQDIDDKKAEVKELSSDRPVLRPEDKIQKLAMQALSGVEMKRTAQDSGQLPIISDGPHGTKTWQPTIKWKWSKDLNTTTDREYQFCDKDERCFKTSTDLYRFESLQAIKKDSLTMSD